MNLISIQKPSRYINKEINAIYKKAPVKVALAFPDIYEIGMSHLGLKILYKIINDLPFASAERVFSPWIDLEAQMKSGNIILESLEFNRPLREFDIIGFSLQYELSFTTVLNILSLGGVPLRTEDRVEHLFPLVIAGGPCTVNPFPMSPFIDAFLIGDGEDAIKEILNIYYLWKSEGDGKKESLFYALSNIEGIYVPAIHKTPLNIFNKSTKKEYLIKRRFIQNLDDAPYPENPVIPYTAIIHDRINIEVSRGCSMGCRFCQAGIIYRPVRERSPDKVLDLAKKNLKNTGYDEVSFTSLSAGDYSCLLQIVKNFNNLFHKKRISLSLPSLRVASINRNILKEIRTVRKTGFTIAPEAGTHRLRNVINKDFSDSDYENALKILFEEGWHKLKLYFMIGLPTETTKDIEGIIQMVMLALKIAKQNTKRRVNINIGISPFVPKAHTPFQWYGQNPINEMEEKKGYITKKLSKKGVYIKTHNLNMSLLEAAFSRGDAKLSSLIEIAWSLGCRLDGWSEVFDFDKWKEAMNRTGLDVEEYAKKTYTFTDTLPWEKIDTGVTKEFLWKEYQKGLSGNITIDCRKVCHNCGLRCDQKLRRYENNNISYTTSQPLHFMPIRIRAEFSKTGLLKYLSHLEVMSVIIRALRRADVNLEYSKGYHPVPEISFGPPLAVGVAGLSEYFDMKVLQPFDLTTYKKNINAVLPEGIYIKDMAVIPFDTESLNSFIKRYEYEIKGLKLTNINKFLSEKEIFFKRNQKEVNLRNMLEEVKQINENTVSIILVDHEETKVRLSEILQVIMNTPFEELDITRISLYGWKSGWIKPLQKNSLQMVDYID
ncbi:MAG: TIGR03960 family B12-binding radical SAM protein [Nitrospirae bacterium]|nr:TIGR03960 family B12-binding radical SAM protein [Nitrospirota bacterium]